MNGSLIFLIIALLCWGTAPIFEKYGLYTLDAFSAVLIRSVAVAVIVAVVALMRGNFSILWKAPKNSSMAFVIGGILAGIIGMWAYFRVLHLNPSSKAVPIISMYPLVTMILSIIFLGEQVTWVRCLGTILIVTGVLLIR